MNGKHADGFEDENLEFRQEVLEYFKKNYSMFPVPLIAALYEAETEFAKEAWGVSPAVSLLAQEMLERGRSTYVPIYLKGWARGRDAHIQSKQIKLSKECINELISYSNGRQENDDFQTRNKHNYSFSF
ncbi:hypothetical protein B9G39_29330 [Zooshikella ganghwensis]|uniref:Uncharacterized protein n=2 Tax=Zooshikella ganghwensis TaxID=202772 RepID=A0A4P9VDR3_9GAMM|nr:hypothetical protein B9G39_29330 [Zooshikella ganghwensis]